MHTVVVLALPDTIVFDLATPIEVFGRARLSGDRRAYDVSVCGTAPVVTAGPVGLAVDRGLDGLRGADTIVVPGRNDPSTPVSTEVLGALRRAESAGTRIASICVGAFTLAEAELLDGKRATTHWRAAAAFRALFPAVDLDPDVLYVDNGQVLTSAGATAGVDLCLHMVRRDYGAAVAADASRLAVAPLHRDGGQAQFIVRNAATMLTTSGFQRLLAWIEENAHREVTLGDIASEASVSVRTLNRRFHEEVGATPMNWLAGVRIRMAQALLETTDHSVEHIARRVGFSSPTNFRVQFKRLSGVAPQAYRNTFHR